MRAFLSLCFLLIPIALATSLDTANDSNYKKFKRTVVVPVFDANENATNNELATLVLKKYRETTDRHCLLIVTIPDGAYSIHRNEFGDDGDSVMDDASYKGRKVFLYLASEGFEELAKTKKSELAALDKDEPRSLSDVGTLLAKNKLAYFLATPMLPEYPFSVAKSREDVGVVKKVKMDNRYAFVAVVF